LHRYLQGQLPDDFSMSESVWARIKEEPRARWILAYNNDALYNSGLIDRWPLEGTGPRGLARSPDGKELAVAFYFSGTIQLVDPMTQSVKQSIALGHQPEPDMVRQGEMIFYDATYSWQFWLSCATCHPDGGRADGLNWDMLNDGKGNPKNTKSLLWAHRTPPMSWRGVRESYHASVEKGFDFLFQQPEPEDVVAVKAYLEAQQPLVSPHRNEDDSLSTAAQRGEALFHSKKTRCATCHPPPLYADLKQHNVGTRREKDKDARFDTPALVEVFRTHPYLHSGASADLREMLTEQNAGDKHGKTSQLSDQELDDLIAFLLSL
jgi:cytochrome c peroxidase